MSEENSWWGWGSNLIKTVAETVQETGTEILQVYKEDFTELSTIVAEDSKSLIETVQTQVQQHGVHVPIDSDNLKQLVSDGLTAVGEFAGNQIHLLKEDYVETQAWIVEKMDNFEAEETYADDKEYLEWQKTFVWTEHKDDIQQILGKNPTIMNVYQELVPGEISPSDFWSRYYYKLHLTKQEETKRTKLIQKSTSFNIVNDMGWDDGGDFLDDEEPEINSESNNKPSELDEGKSEVPTEEKVVSENEPNEKSGVEQSSEVPESIPTQPLVLPVSNPSPVKTQPVNDESALEKEANESTPVPIEPALPIEKERDNSPQPSPQVEVNAPVQPDLKASGESAKGDAATGQAEDDEDWLNWQ